MKLSVSSKNEYCFYPDILDNLEKEESERFTIVLRKVNQVLSGADWLKYDDEKKPVRFDLKARAKAHFKEIRNAPILSIDGETERELTIDDILDENYPELYSIAIALNNFILDLGENKEDPKKS